MPSSCISISLLNIRSMVHMQWASLDGQLNIVSKNRDSIPVDQTPVRILPQDVREDCIRNGTEMAHRRSGVSNGEGSQRRHDGLPREYAEVEPAEMEKHADA